MHFWEAKFTLFPCTNEARCVIIQFPQVVVTHINFKWCERAHLVEEIKIKSFKLIKWNIQEVESREILKIN